MRKLNQYISARATWEKSPFSNTEPLGCVELALLEHGFVAVRDSKDQDGPALLYTGQEMDAFLRGVRAGHFDHFLLPESEPAV